MSDNNVKTLNTNGICIVNHGKWKGTYVYIKTGNNTDGWIRLCNIKTPIVIISNVTNHKDMMRNTLQSIMDAKCIYKNNSVNNLYEIWDLRKIFNNNTDIRLLLSYEDRIRLNMENKRTYGE